MPRYHHVAVPQQDSNVPALPASPMFFTRQQSWPAAQEFSPPLLSPLNLTAALPKNSVPTPSEVAHSDAQEFRSEVPSQV